MKLSAPQSLKFSKLKRRLGIPYWQVVGLLESLWLFTQSNAPAGDIGRHSDDDIAAGIEWDGDATNLIQDLVDCGWVDRSETHRLLIHDWEEHAPTFLKGSMAKYKKEFAKNEGAKEGAKQGAKQGAKEGAKQGAKEGAKQGAPILSNPIQTNPRVENPSDADASITHPTLEGKKSKSASPKQNDDSDGKPWSAEVVPLPDHPELREAWPQWASVRSALGKSKILTNRCARLALAQMKKAGLSESEMADCVQESVMGSYQGLFPDRILERRKHNKHRLPTPSTNDHHNGTPIHKAQHDELTDFQRAMACDGETSLRYAARLNGKELEHYNLHKRTIVEKEIEAQKALWENSKLDTNWNG